MTCHKQHINDDIMTNCSLQQIKNRRPSRYVKMTSVKYIKYYIKYRI